MQIQLTADEAGALLALLPAAARERASGFVYADGTLAVPAPFEAAVAAILAEPGWANAGVIAAALESYRLPVEAHIEATATAKGYGSAVSCSSYVSSKVPAWKAEAEAFVGWRDEAWTAVIGLQHAWIAAGADPAAAPSVDDVLAAIPAVTWP
ncbi:hypothetical protein [Salinarimonas soli]|uniref:Uncharacterized protein n=1 Tax=Salinarimonas soli TaxID=1638099 RepID=A0A5B2VH44_9HYPH|nr:hypothetical protein [Salinarimonas soli]KAA2237659.1 hypothetical protein F0L46_08235 [Salinarimonas soli]